MSDGHKVYVGNLPSDIRERDLEDMFYKYGKIVEVDLHARKGIPFAFIEFEDSRDAEDAIRGKDGYTFDGCRLRVEYPRSSRDGRRDSYRGFSGDRGGRGFGGGRGGGGGGRGGRRPKGFQLSVTGLPPTGSWQDIKDHFRQAGDVIFADVFRDGTGVVEFMKSDHAKRALRDLDDSKFKSHEGESAYIRVKDRERSRSRSYSPRRSRSRSPRRSPVRRSPRHSPRRSPKYSPRYSRSRSRSYSPRRSRSRSGSR